MEELISSAVQTHRPQWAARHERLICFYYQLPNGALQVCASKTLYVFILWDNITGWWRKMLMKWRISTEVTCCMIHRTVKCWTRFSIISVISASAASSNRPFDHLQVTLYLNLATWQNDGGAAKGENKLAETPLEVTFTIWFCGSEAVAYFICDCIRVNVHICTYKYEPVTTRKSFMA